MSKIIMEIDPFSIPVNLMYFKDDGVNYGITELGGVEPAIEFILNEITTNNVEYVGLASQVSAYAEQIKENLDRQLIVDEYNNKNIIIEVLK